MSETESKDYVKKKANPYIKNKEIPSFTFRGALAVAGFAILGTFIFPVMFMWLIDFKLLIVIGNTFITSFGIAFTRFNIETKRGFTKGFYILWFLFGLSFFVLTFIWMFVNYQGTWYI